MEWMTEALGLTGKTLPLNSARRMLCNVSRPIVPRCVEAPITATDLGWKIESRVCLAAIFYNHNRAFVTELIYWCTPAPHTEYACILVNNILSE